MGLGMYGLDKNENESNRPPHSLQEAVNIALHENSLQRAFGETAVTTSSSIGNYKVRAGIEYVPIDGSQRQAVYTSNGTILYATGVGLPTAWSSAKTGLNGTKVGQFVEAGYESLGGKRKLFFFNGTDYPRYAVGDFENAQESGAGKMDRVGYRTTLINPLDTTIADQTLTINYTAHGLDTGMTVSLTDFAILGETASNLNVEAGYVTKIDDDSFSVEMAAGASTNTTGGGGTGHIYVHPADWTGTSQPEGAVFHVNRLIAWKGQWVYVSSLSDHADFEIDGLSYPVYSGLGTKIIAGASIYGRLILFKTPRGICQIVNPASATTYAQSVLHQEIGIAGKHAWCMANKDIWFMSDSASFHYLSAVDVTGDMSESSVSSAFFLDAWIKSQINMSKLDQAHMVFDLATRTILCSVCRNGSSENDYLIKIDINNPQMPRFSVEETKGSYVSLWLQRDSNNEPRTVAGTSDGNVRYLSETTRKVDDTAFTSRARTQSLDFGDQYPEVKDTYKRIDFIEATLNPRDGDIEIAVDVYADGERVDSVTLTADADLVAFPVTFPVEFTDPYVQHVREKIEGAYGKRFELEVRSQNTNNFRLTNTSLLFVPGEETLTASG